MSITIVLIIVTVIASYGGWKNYSAFEKYTFKPYRVAKYNEYFRFISSGFLHADGNHLFSNMLTLFFFGPALERNLNYGSHGLGYVYFLGLYITALFVSELGTFTKYKTDSRYSSIGASGAVSAVVFAEIWFDPLLRIWFIIPGFIYGGLYLMYTANAAKNDYTGQINHDAHFYGSVWGILFTLLFFPETLSEFQNTLINYKIFG